MPYITVYLTTMFHLLTSHILFVAELKYNRKREREMFYLTMHSTHFIYGYMASDIWLSTILIVRKETHCHHIGYSYRLTTRVLLYAPSHRQDNTYHGLCYTSHGALAGMRNSSMGPPHEGSIRRPIVPWANALPLSYVPLPNTIEMPPVCGYAPKKNNNWIPTSEQWVCMCCVSSSVKRIFIFCSVERILGFWTKEVHLRGGIGIR